MFYKKALMMWWTLTSLDSFGLLGQARLRGKFSKAAIIKLFSRCLNYPRLQVRLMYQLLFMNFHKSAFKRANRNMQHSNIIS